MSKYDMTVRLDVSEARAMVEVAAAKIRAELYRFFSCPACSGDGELKLVGDTVFASPVEPCIECADCGTCWRVELHEVEQPAGEETEQ